MEYWNVGLPKPSTPLFQYAIIPAPPALDCRRPFPYGAAVASIAALFGMEKLAPGKARALSIVYAASIALMMGVNFIQPALPALSQPFAVSDAQLSWIMTVFTAPAIVLSPIFGIVADLYGRRLLLALGLIAFGAFGTAMAFAPTFGWLLFWRTLQGIGFSAVIPLTIVLIGDLL